MRRTPDSMACLALSLCAFACTASTPPVEDGVVAKARSMDTSVCQTDSCDKNGDLVATGSFTREHKDINDCKDNGGRAVTIIYVSQSWSIPNYKLEAMAGSDGHEGWADTTTEAQCNANTFNASFWKLASIPGNGDVCGFEVREDPPAVHGVWNAAKSRCTTPHLTSLFSYAGISRVDARAKRWNGTDATVTVKAF